MNLPVRLNGILLSAVLLGALYCGSLWLIPSPWTLDDPDYSRVVTDADDTILRVALNTAGQVRLPLAGPVPEKLRTAVLWYEDRRFGRHPGVDVVAAARALRQNVSTGRRVSGASTITMQVARIRGSRRRTLGAKLLESLESLKLEVLHDKDRILRAYLSNAPYGGNIVGVTAASLSYFGKPPESLSWAEAATLAVLPNAPGLISPTRNSDELVTKRDRLLHALHDAGHIDAETRDLALAEPPPAGRRPFPFHAPHLSRYLMTKAVNEGWLPSRPIRSTIDLSLQNRVEEIVSYHGTSLQAFGIDNAAAIVAETSSGKVRAYVGSVDFYQDQTSGKVDGALAPRSTGSVLKPFLYALAMDEGLLVPQTRLLDVPTQFGSFSPRNLDRSYRGLVTAREALVSSLNVPAVRLLSDYGVDRFYRFLELAGVSTLFRTPTDYGLPLVLGGAEGSLIEMAGLYRGLGRGGRFSSLVLTEDGAPGKETALISPGASHLTLEVLRDLKRPGAEYAWQSYQGGKPLAWKTGTSYGQRDAWAIGVSPEWTLAVWVGNFSGEGNPALRSASTAAPLLFDLFNVLPGSGRWFAAESGSLQAVRVWSETGYRAPPHAEEAVYVMAPAEARPLPLCPYHAQIRVTLDGQFRVDAGCWTPGEYREETRLVYPATAAQYLRERGQRVSDLPPPAPGCSQTDDEPLQIVYPEQDARLWIPRDLDGSYQKVTLRAAHRDAGPLVYWYVDGVYRGATRVRHTRALLLNRGVHRLEVVDERGHRVSRSFSVISEAAGG